MAEYVVDVKGETLGRAASRIASLLQGKNLPTYEKRKVGDSKVIVKNVHLLKVTGRKASQKIYYRHTGYMGHLKSRKYKDIFAVRPEWVLRHAVSGMLPRNSLKPRRLKLLVFVK